MKRAERVGWTLSQEIFKRFWNNFYFVQSMVYGTKAVIWRTLFIANVFQWTETVFIESVRPTRQWLILRIPLTIKLFSLKDLFPLQRISRYGTTLYVPQVTILIHIFQWGILFQAANNAYVESLTSWGFKGLGIERMPHKFWQNLFSICVEFQ